MLRYFSRVLMSASGTFFTLSPCSEYTSPSCAPSLPVTMYSASSPAVSPALLELSIVAACPVLPMSTS